MKKILIVDDELMMLKMADRILSERYETVCASSGAEAMELFEREKPDMVLSDLHMPKMDGYELHRNLQEMSGEPVPVMFMTTDASDQSESMGFDVGAADYIRKPLKAEVLLRRINNILQNIDKIRHLQEAATTDPLTRLMNKGASQREIGRLCGETGGVLLMVDLDSFKLVNDIHGHSMGDKVLQRFASLLRSSIRSADLAGRIGGDEFIVFLRGVQEETVLREKTGYLNEELVRFAKEILGEEMTIPLGVSVGVAFTPADGYDFKELSQKADEALYGVKKKGKHGVGFYKSHRHTDDEGQDISQLRQIMGERETPNGAWLLEFEQFQLMYRFLMRQGGKMPSLLLRLALQSGPIRDNEEAAKQFAAMLQKTLRRSDCIMQHGDSQFFVLLTAVGENDGAQAAERIKKAWEQEPAAANCGFDCAMERL